MAVLNGKETSPLGFGGSYLGSTSAGQAERLLHAAFDAGIRHFDVAPLYGFGKAERLLGRAFRGRMGEITVTTKYGLEPARNSAFIAPVHRIVRSLVKKLPAVKRRLQQASQGVSPAPPAAPLTAAGAKVSLERSLTELGVSSIDLYLLHEASPERLTDPALLDFLEESRREGKIRQFGIGSESRAALACVQAKPAYCPVVQTEWSVFSLPQMALAGRQRIQHGSLGDRRLEFLQWLESEPQRVSRWSQEVNADLKDGRVVNRLLFRAALLHAAGNIVLFSTKVIANLHENVRTAEDSSLDAPALALQRLVQEEFAGRMEQTGPAAR